MNDLVPQADTRPRTERVAVDQRDGVRPGTWWSLREDWPQRDGSVLPAGEVMLCEKVEFADGVPHTVHFLAPPSTISDADLRQGRTQPIGWRDLVDDFLARFRPVTGEAALAHRERQLALLQKRLSDLSGEIATAQGDLVLLTAAPLATGQPALPAPGRGIPVHSEASPPVPAVGRDPDSVRSGLLARQESISRAVEGIQARAGAMQITTSRMAAYYAERARAAIASVDPAIQVAERIREKVDTMGLYLGSGVDVRLLCDGDPAPGPSRLWLLQRRLYLDEELLVHATDGGADYRDANDLGQTLAGDPLLMARLFPSDRAVVVASWRRHAKTYESDASSFAGAMMDALGAAQDNVENMRTFLLVRNGGKVWHIRLPDALTSLPRLFPTPDDLEAPYTQRDWWRAGETRRIGPDSLDYAKATEEFRALSVLYDRVLTLLWGLHDRQALFGEDFAAEGGYSGFGDPRLQADRFRFLFDDERLLGQGRPPYWEWIAARNATLRSGSRVAVLWGKAMTPESAPGAVVGREDRQGYTRHSFRHAPVSEFGVVVARREGAAIVVDCEVASGAYGSERRFNARVDLRRAPSERWGFSYLVLDDVEPEDIDHYLHSREERQHYLAYVALLVHARDALRREAMEQADAMEVLRRDVVSGGLDEPDTGWDRLLREAVRDWRADNRGAVLPSPGEAGWAKAHSSLLSRIWFLAGNAEDRDLAKAATDALLPGEKPARLVRDAAGRLVLYAHPSPEKAASGLKMLGTWPFMIRRVLDKRRGTDTEPGAGEISRQSELPLQSWEEAAAGLPILGFRDGRALTTALDLAASLVDGGIMREGGVATRDLLFPVLDRVTRMSAKGKRVLRPELLQPIGIAARRERDPDSGRFVGIAGSVACLAIDGLDYLCLTGEEDVERAVRKFIGGIYQKPEAKLEDLATRDKGADWRVRWLPLTGSLLRTFASERIPFSPEDIRGTHLRAPDPAEQGDWQYRGDFRWAVGAAVAQAARDGGGDHHWFPDWVSEMTVGSRGAEEVAD